VKNYLVGVMGINSEQIQARGYGASKFLVAPRPVMEPAMEQAEIARQQPNRRVVIVVHTSGE
jgi:outer membrane protein OmpA-like peptidoglycan-associated protein